MKTDAPQPGDGKTAVSGNAKDMSWKAKAALILAVAAITLAAHLFAASLAREKEDVAAQKPDIRKVY